MLNRKTVCVLGAGNAGLMAALILNREKPGLNVYVVGSSELGIVGVGESSTEHVNYFRELMGISVKEFVQRSGCTFKFGVDFRGWTEKRYVHSLVVDDADTNELMRYLNMSSGCDPIDLISEYQAEDRVRENDGLPNQFHFDTQKFNKFLRELLEQDRIIFYDDKIEKVNIDEMGNCKSIESATSIYEADMFVDASGFRRIIASEVPGFEFKSRQNDLFVDSAFAFQCPHEEPDNYPVHTQAHKMSCGWMWRIPTSERMGNGYAYSSKHISYEDAVKEVTEKLGFEPKVAKTFKFEAGNYNKTWVGNTVLVGLSSHFYEPLEATAIGVGIQQAKLLSTYINSGPKSKETYNTIVQDLFEQVFAFVRLHYVNCITDSKFWEDVKSSHLPIEVKKYIDIAQERVLLLEDVGNISGAVSTENRIFGSHNWNQVLYALGLLSNKVLVEHVESYGQMPRRKHFAERDTLLHKDLITKWNREYENSINN